MNPDNNIVTYILIITAFLIGGTAYLHREELKEDVVRLKAVSRSLPTNTVSVIDAEAVHQRALKEADLSNYVSREAYTPLPPIGIAYTNLTNQLLVKRSVRCPHCGKDFEAEVDVIDIERKWQEEAERAFRNGLKVGYKCGQLK